MDADDPLWLAVLKLAGGDAKKANQMLEDPDALMAYPEVAALLTGGGAEEGAWDADEADEEVAALPPPAPKTAKAAKADSRPPTPTDDDQSHGSHDDHDDSATLGEEDPREHLNVVFIGHVDAGKSTLSGNILYLTGYVDKRTIEKYEREAKQRNRESWFLAFIMDTNEEERAKGKTVEVGRAPFATAAKRYTILDAPGHKNYVPHMISGAAQADVGILVISARRGEFETGFERGGQTREHAMLAKTLGVRYLVVVINKMDDATVNWSKDRFDECVSKLKPFLKTCGYIIKSEVKFLPISGLSGANVLVQVPTEQCNWWQECVNAGENNTADPTLIQCLDALSLTGRSADSPLRIPVLDRFYERGTICMGKVESGRVRKGDVLTIMPTKVTCKVEQIYVNETEPVVSAKPGENINMKLSGINVEDISKGFVICGGPTQRRCHAVTTFTCQLALVELLEHRPIFTAGYTCMLHAHTCESEVAVAELISQVNAKGKGPQRALHFAKMGALIICKLTVPQTICLEVYDDMAFLGRFTLRDEGKTIAIGKVLSFDD
ncbi:P-loop containing nucleoside triphosphate hydrolase protein [Pelagophyceae sp. CCMP2097]|nr:P-loop containing nucleoside triphosphate hydrolase protein [Pelagophyceae sp. CCMP2097]